MKYLLSLDDLVAFAQEGWHYPLADDEHTRAAIEGWLETNEIEEVEDDG